MAEEDIDLVERALDGDREAFQDLVVMYQNRVLTLLARMLRDRELALDLSQEVFLKAFRNLDQLKSSRKFGSWIMQMAHNRALDYLKKRRPDAILTDFTDQRTEQTLAGQGVATSPEEDPEAILERLGDTEILELLEEIDLKHRTILILRFLEDLPFQQIAEIMDLPLSTVKFRKFWAVKQLKQKILERRKVQKGERAQRA